MTTTYADKLQRLAKRWKKTKPFEGGGGEVPPGKYQVTCKKAQIMFPKSGNRQGHMCVQFLFQILKGEQSRRYTPSIIYDLEWAHPDRTELNGLALLMALLDKFHVKPDDLSEESLEEALSACRDQVCDVSVVEKNGFFNTYVDRLVTAPAGDDNFQAEDLEEEEAQEKREKRRRPKKRQEPEEAIDDEEFEFEEDEDDEEEDEEAEAMKVLDGEPKKKKKKRGPGRPKGSKNKPKEDPKPAKKQETEDDDDEDSWEDEWSDDDDVPF